MASIRSGIGENIEDRYLYKAKHIHILPGNDHLDGSWVVGFLSGERWITNDSGEYLIDTSTICQCTGLKDDNDTLIFENDVLSLADKVSDYEWKAVVKFGNPDSNDTWGWHLVPITECYVNREILLWVETELNTVECRVIGNIFDNKELLESEEN